MSPYAYQSMIDYDAYRETALEAHKEEMIFWWKKGERIAGYLAEEAATEFRSLERAADLLGEADLEETEKLNEKFRY